MPYLLSLCLSQDLPFRTQHAAKELAPDLIINVGRHDFRITLDRLFHYFECSNTQFEIPPIIDASIGLIAADRQFALVFCKKPFPVLNNKRLLGNRNGKTR